MSPVARLPKTLAIAVAGFLPAAGCTVSDNGSPQTASAFYMKDAHDKFRAHLAGCSARFGYNTEVANAQGRYQLAPNELAWRDCAYEGVRSTLLPSTKHPELYTALIEKDRAMTQQIQARRMTRVQRRQQLDVSFARIEEQERREALQARPGTPSSMTRTEQLERQAMPSINVVMAPLR